VAAPRAGAVSDLPRRLADLGFRHELADGHSSASAQVCFGSEY
jgi:hypothetical protein